MSRPYLRIDNVSYSTASNVLSVSVHALRIRGYDNENDIIIEGFSQSKTLPISNGFFQGTVTYSIPDLETSTASVSDTTTYVPATKSWTFGGTATADDSVTITSTDLSQLFIYTFSAGTTTTTATVDALVATMSVNATGDWAGFTASRVGDAFKLDAPWGAYYNGLNVTATIATQSGSTLTISPTASELEGGSTNYNLNFKRSNPLLGSLGTDTFSFTVGTYAVGS